MEKERYKSPAVALEVLRMTYTRNLGENTCYLLANYFSNLRILQLSSCPIGLSDCTLLGARYVPYLEELDLSGDSFISRKSLLLLSVACTQIGVFHLGHFEHSDYVCERTVLKAKGQ